MEERGKIELIAQVEQRYPNEWLGFVIPPGEDEFEPQHGMLVVHSADDNEVWDALNRVTNNQVVHVYFNGVLDGDYLNWAETAPAQPGMYVPAFVPPATIPHTLLNKEREIIPLLS